MALRLSGALLLIINIGVVNADDIYQYTDKNGTTVYSNKPSKGAKKVNLPPITVYASPMTKADYNAKSYTDPTAKKVKVVKNGSQQNLGTNETGRRQVLTEELNHEKLALEDAQKALDTAKQTKLDSEKNNPTQYQARIQALQDAVTEHQKNIDILSNQLGN